MKNKTNPKSLYTRSDELRETVAPVRSLGTVISLVCMSSWSKTPLGSCHPSALPTHDTAQARRSRDHSRCASSPNQLLILQAILGWFSLLGENNAYRSPRLSASFWLSQAGSVHGVFDHSWKCPGPSAGGTPGDTPRGCGSLWSLISNWTGTWSNTHLKLFVLPLWLKDSQRVLTWIQQKVACILPLRNPSTLYWYFQILAGSVYYCFEILGLRVEKRIPRGNNFAFPSAWGPMDEVKSWELNIWAGKSPDLGEHQWGTE